MKVFLIGTMVSFLLTGVAAAQNPGLTDADGWAAKAGAIMDDTLVDYPSARFRNVRAVMRKDAQKTDRMAFCGEVNSKNKMGGYTGWSHFVLDPSEFGGPVGAMWTDSTGLGAAMVQTACQGEVTVLPKDYTSAFAPK